MKRRYILALVLVVFALLCGCTQESAPPEQGDTVAMEPPKADIGGTALEYEVTELNLQTMPFTYEKLLAASANLTAVTRIDLGVTGLSSDEIDGIRAAYPNAQVNYSIDLFGEIVDMDAEVLDLSGMTVDQTDALVEALSLLPLIRDLYFVAADGTCVYSVEDIQALDKIQAAAPEAYLHVCFDLFGQIIASEDILLEFVDAEIGNEGASLIRAVLPYLRECTYLLMDDCGVDDEVMAQLRDDFPDIEIVWRVYFGKYNCLTNTEMIRATHGLLDEHISTMSYCTKVKYMDLGHNIDLTNTSFASAMPELEILILSGSTISDLSAFENHPSIEFLEMCYCSRVTDISPLANCANLKYLNISFCHVSDLTPLDNVQLERFNCMGNNVPSEGKLAFEEQHPDCLTRFTGKQPFGYGWRYVDNGITFWDYYANMRVIFMYDDVSYYTGKEHK